MWRNSDNIPCVKQLKLWKILSGTSYSLAITIFLAYEFVQDFLKRQKIELKAISI